MATKSEGLQIVNRALAAQTVSEVDAASADFEAAKGRIRSDYHQAIRLVIDARREALTATGQQPTNDTGTQESETP